MADFSAPSFSLGLDFDLSADEEEGGGDDDKPEEPSPSRSESRPEAFQCQSEEDDGGRGGGDFNLQTLEEEHPLPVPALKRLRRGPPPRVVSTPPASLRGGVELRSVEPPCVDDDIEDFSSLEDSCLRVPEECASATIQNRSACSSSKISLHGHGFLTQSASKWKDMKVKAVSCAPTSSSVEGSSNKKCFPKLTISPLRKIQLLDSGSDDDAVDNGRYEGIREVNFFPKEIKFASTHSVTGNQQKKSKSSTVNLQTESFWKDFSPKTNINLPTPALDEFCEEYFKSTKGSNFDQHEKGNMSFINTGELDSDGFIDRTNSHYHNSNSLKQQRVMHHLNLPDPQPPAYNYFYHDDFRIQKLVKDRLPYFFPIGSVNSRGNQQFDKGIDYMSQFGTRDIPSQVRGAGKIGLEGSSKRRKKNPIDAEVVSQASESWLSPKSSVTLSKDAGKRRVSANSRPSGHWYTGENGKKVYVNRNGKELSGQIAYRHYRKESGTAFRKSKKKAASGSKRSSVGKKKVATGNKKFATGKKIKPN